MEGEIAVIVDDVRAGADAEEAREAIRLVMLVNDVSLRRLAATELAKGFGFFQSKPSSAFSPVAVTPDELAAVTTLADGPIHIHIAEQVREVVDCVAWSGARPVCRKARPQPSRSG